MSNRHSAPLLRQGHDFALALDDAREHAALPRIVSVSGGRSRRAKVDVDVAAAKARAAYAQAQRLAQIQRRAAAEQGVRVIVSQNQRGEVQEELIHKTRFQKGKTQFTAAFAEHVRAVQLPAQRPEQPEKSGPPRGPGPRARTRAPFWRNAWAVVEAAAAGEARKIGLLRPIPEQMEISVWRRQTRSEHAGPGAAALQRIRRGP